MTWSVGCCVTSPAGASAPRSAPRARSWSSTTSPPLLPGQAARGRRHGRGGRQGRQGPQRRCPVWFKGLQAIARKVGLKGIYDLSATPFYLKGSGYNEGYIFPWVVSDFSLMDAIESGIVKVPRVPVDDDAVGDLPTYLRLWDHVGKELPKKLKKEALTTDWVPPKVLEGAMESLHRSYQRRFGSGSRASCGTTVSRRR
jgi:hypothetical protein